jgi:hypothetical protein
VSKLNVSICDGKYTVIQEPTGETRVLRYGEEWRDVTGDNVICGLAWELQESRERINRLEEWKESAMAVEREWNPNSLSKMLGGQLGESQRKVIQREVPKLLTRIKRLEEAGNQMELVLISFQIFSDFRKSDSIRASLNWRKAKEAKS